ncbi:MAG: hypothetical protein ACQGVC_11830 [Myxococcota bacterium]
MYGSGLGESDWYRLKDAVLGAGAGNFHWFDALPKRLREHPVGALLAEAKAGRKRAVREAELLLVPNDPKRASLILEKA